jgi:hypothetical protein
MMDPLPEVCKATVKSCKHCGGRFAIKARGLCGVCHTIPNIRILYPTYGEEIVENLSEDEKCVHCKVRKKARPRGLCQACYYSSEIRGVYPDAIYDRWKEKLGDMNGGYKLPSEPTDARPGTEEKIKVLADRAEKKVCLFHPLDKLNDDDESLDIFDSDDDFPDD